MFKESKLKFNQIISSESDNISLNTNYLTIATIVANKALEKGELTVNSGEANILTLTNKYTDMIGNVAIIDRGRFKSILNKVLKSTIGFNRDMRNSSTLSELLGTDIGEVDYSRNVGSLVKLVLIIFYSGE